MSAASAPVSPPSFPGEVQTSLHGDLCVFSIFSLPPKYLRRSFFNSRYLYRQAASSPGCCIFIWFSFCSGPRLRTVNITQLPEAEHDELSPVIYSLTLMNVESLSALMLLHRINKHTESPLPWSCMWKEGGLQRVFRGFVAFLRSRPEKTKKWEERKRKTGNLTFGVRTARFSPHIRFSVSEWETSS